MIPKTVHYIWIGSKIPNKIQMQIDKNSQFFKEYEVKIWTEENIPPLNAFAQQAFNEKKWAFVSDYLRFYILHKEGGIYLDTDMDVLKPLDDLLVHNCFSGWDRTGKYVYAGIVGAEANHPYIHTVLESYNKIEEGEYPTSPEMMTRAYSHYSKQEDIKIYDSAYFYPLLDGEKESSALMKDAYTNHLWHESWRTFVPLRRFFRRVGLMKLYHYALSKIKG